MRCYWSYILSRWNDPFIWKLNDATHNITVPNGRLIRVSYISIVGPSMDINGLYVTKFQSNLISVIIVQGYCMLSDIHTWYLFNRDKLMTSPLRNSMMAYTMVVLVKRSYANLQYRIITLVFLLLRNLLSGISDYAICHLSQ